jgi:cytochrome c-type biogenesis protein
MGLHFLGLTRIAFLMREGRLSIPKPVGLGGAYVMGLAFAFGWTPCIGPILAGILAVAASQDTIWKGVQLLAVYSLGLGIPFLITALAINQFFAAFARIRRHYHKIEVVSGALLVAIGVLIFTDQFTIIARWLTPYLPTF